MTGRTARCRCKFWYVSNFTTASCSFSATARLSCVRHCSDRSSAEITHSTLIFTAVTQSRKSRHADDQNQQDKEITLSLRWPRDVPNIWVSSIQYVYWIIARYKIESWGWKLYVGLCKRKISRRLRKNLHITILSLFCGEIIFEVFYPMWSRHLMT